jgi:hypothetical protein
MRRPSMVALLAATVAIWTGLPHLSFPASAEPAFPPGLRIGLEPMSDLVVSRRFPGFEDAGHKVAITILDLPARAYEEIERSIFAKNQSGLADVKRESFPFAGGVGILISGQAQDKGVTSHKWFLLATSAGGAVADLATLINVDVPDSARAVYSDAAVRKLLTSVAFRPTPLQEQVGLLPFKVNDMAGFRVMQVLPAGGVILTDGPSDDISKQPYVIISLGGGSPDQPDDRARFARELLSSAPLREVAVTSAEPMRISGLQGYEIRAQARGIDGEAVTLVQWVRFGSGGFLRVVAVAGKDNWDALFTRFRAIRDGVEPK